MGNFSTYLGKIIQWILTECLFDDESAIKNIGVILGADISSSDVSIIMAEIQEVFRSLHLELRRVYSFATDSHIWIVYNTVGDGIAQLATKYSPEEVESFKLLLRSISESPQYSVSSIETTSQHSSKKHWEDFLEDLISGQWLLKSSSGKILVGPRTSVELESYLVDEELFFPCSVCRLLVTSKHAKCSSVSCNCRQHKSCFDRVKTSNANLTCPACDMGTIVGF